MRVDYSDMRVTSKKPATLRRTRSKKYSKQNFGYDKQCSVYLQRISWEYLKEKNGNGRRCVNVSLRRR
jgi:hypothetical protein